MMINSTYESRKNLNHLLADYQYHCAAIDARQMTPIQISFNNLINSLIAEFLKHSLEMERDKAEFRAKTNLVAHLMQELNKEKENPWTKKSEKSKKPLKKTQPKRKKNSKTLKKPIKKEIKSSQPEKKP